MSIKELIIQYRMGTDIGEQFIHALNYLSKNSKVMGNDLFPYNPHKELYYNSNKRDFFLNDYIQSKNNSTKSVFLIKDKDILKRNTNYYNKIKIKNKPSKYKRNSFFEENMTAIGGGNLLKLKACQDYVRCGGSTIDKVRYLTGYNSLRSETKFFFDGYLRLSPKKLAKKIKPDGLIKKLRILSNKEVKSTIKINMEANPGYILSKVGFNNKKDCLGTTMGAFDAIYANWINEKRGSRIQIYWTMASRPKIMTWEKAIEKVRHEEALGRVISLPDAIEQWLNHPVWYPVMEEIKSNNKYCIFGSTPILLGLNRVGYEWNELRNHMKTFKYIYTGDWSKFDRRVNVYLFENAIEAVSLLFDDSDTNTKNYISNWKSFVREEVMNGTYVIDDKYEIERIGGMPSGSLLTSLFDSIINYNAIFEVMCSMGYEENEFEIGTYGDDHYILFNEIKSGSPNAFKEEFFGMANAMFGFDGSIEEACLSTTEFMEVRYKRPIYKEPWPILLQGTSKLKPVKWEYSKNLFKSYDLTKGQTHRQMYDFKNKPKFLSYYWRDDGMPIRPLIECELRILNPERKVKDISDHEAMIWSWIFENIYNTHFVNDMYYVLMDIQYMKDEWKIWGKDNVSLIKECKYKNYYYSLPDKLIDMNQRMWFRRKDLKGIVNLNKLDPWIKQFSIDFEIKYRKLQRIYFRIVRGEYHYNVRNQLHNHINRNYGVSRYKKIEYANNDSIRNIIQKNSSASFDEDLNLPNELTSINNPRSAYVQEHIYQKKMSKDYLRILTKSRVLSIREVNHLIIDVRNKREILNREKFKEEKLASMSLNWCPKGKFFFEDFFFVVKIDEELNHDGRIKRRLWECKRENRRIDDIVLIWLSKKKKVS